ncbi:MAG: GTP cyclohydrolase I FolE2 [Candidatus Eisenbacteria bacterium]|nr:GTP cyclohydrolase I FolE2 [Candidatus Eisenbacteria bacterium]
MSTQFLRRVTGPSGHAGGQDAGDRMTRIHDRSDTREIALDRVGIAGLRYPLRVPVRAGSDARADGVVGLWVGLDADERAAHMSRFVSTLEANREQPLGPEAVRRLLEALRENLGSRSASTEIRHPYYIVKRAPTTGAESRLACDVTVEASLNEGGFDHVLSVRVPVLSVCPCSMETTGGDSHSQRGHVTVSVRTQGRVWIEDLVELVETSASAPLYPLLSSDDERTVIEAAHDRPVLVEDLARNVAERLDADVRVLWYSVEARNLDSVHAHDAYASVTRTPRELKAGEADGGET